MAKSGCEDKVLSGLRKTWLGFFFVKKLQVSVRTGEGQDMCILQQLWSNYWLFDH